MMASKGNSLTKAFGFVSCGVDDCGEFVFHVRQGEVNQDVEDEEGDMEEIQVAERQRGALDIFSDRKHLHRILALRLAISHQRR